MNLATDATEEGDFIGKTSSPERSPNDTNNFTCWIKDGIVLSPFDFISADHINGSITVGIVQEITALSDAQSHLSNYLSSDFGNPAAEPQADRLASTIAQVAVLKNTGEPEIRMPLPSDRKVRFSTADEIQLALGASEIVGQRVPAGIINQTNGINVPITIDSAYLLGPEGAHINASGISGLATKTSYLMFLMAGIQQTFGDDVGFIIFNVKQADLLSIDQPADDMTPDDLAMYESLGISPLPFRNVTYFLPRGNRGIPNSDMTPTSHHVYCYELSDVPDRLDLLFADTPDPYFTLDTFVQRVRDDWQNGQLIIQARGRGAAAPITVRNWSDLSTVQHDVLTNAYNLHATTTPRIMRELRRLTASPLFPNHRTNNEEYLGEAVRHISPGQIFVIDINRVPSRTQPFVVGDVMKSIDDVYRQNSSSLPRKIVIFVDELNSIVPSGSSSAIAEQIVEIARKGRSRGTILFGAEQFKSEVHEQVAGNSSIHAIGRTGSSEIRKSAYSFLDDGAKHTIMTLGKGSIVLSSPTWRNAIRMSFPRPPYRKPR